MGKFDGVLICTDLDGTLFRKDKSVSRENREAVAYFKSEGGLFTFITGRMPYYAMDAYRAAEPNVPFGCVNGGGLYDGKTGEYVWTRELPREVFPLIESIDRALPEVGIQVCAFEHTYFCKENGVMQHFRDVTGLPNLVAHYRDVAVPMAKIIFGTDREEEICEIERILRAHPLAADFDFVRSERTLFEILPKGVDKGLALTKLVEYLHIDAEKTVGIGDYNNDIGLFRTARYGIAVANACPAAREAADFVTVSNEEHAIAQVIFDIESGKYRF